jgi:predicted RNA binding protein YcfA (HicA-like mRNA interferase family)
MPRITPISWRRLRCVFERDGFVFVKRTDGSHWIGEKHGVARPIVIPEYSEIGLDIIQANMRTARMSRERYFKLLREC